MANGNLGAMVIEAILAAIPDADAEVSYGGTNADLVGTITDAIATGIEYTRFVEDGTHNGAEGIIRYAEADEPDAWAEDNAIMGELLVVTMPGAVDTSLVRVAGRMIMAGGVRLNVAAEFEEQ